MCMSKGNVVKVSIDGERMPKGNILAVTNRHLCTRPFTEQMERVCSIHPQAVILREKDLSEKDYTVLAQEIMGICQAHNVPLILHTYPGAAKKVIGTSIHSIEEALEAEKLGATYLTAGHIYATDCKKGIPPRGLEFLRKVCQNVSLPVYAIGGIKFDEAQFAELSACGAKGGCIMSGMMTL